MSNDRQIKTPANPDLTTFTIKVNGTELSAVYAVTKIVIEKEVNRIPFAIIVIEDGDTAKEEFIASNSDEFVPGNEVEIALGYHADEEIIFKGVIVKHSIKIRNGGGSLIIECKDKAFQMTLGRKNKYFYDSNDGEIIEEILDNYSLEKEVETSSVTHKELVQYHCTDWDFLVSRAETNGQLVFVDDGKVIVKKPHLDKSVVETVVYGATIMELDVEMDARNQSKTYTSYAWNPGDQEVVEIETTQSPQDLNGNINIETLAKVAGLSNHEVRHGGVISDMMLQQWVDAKDMFHQLAKTQGTVKFQGTAIVKPGELLQLEGVSDRFNGKIYISGVRHELTDGNWTVTAQFGLSPKAFSETYDDINALPASGFLPAINGLQIGIVTQIEEDPEGEERIMVKIPIINHEEQGIWARLSSPDAGENRGLLFRPEIEDEVIVGFINDDPNQAIILGSLHSSAKPAPFEAKDKDFEKGIVTSKELKLVFDDKKNSILIETPNGNQILLSEDEGGILIEDENGNKLSMNSEGISIESSKDLILKAGGNVKINGVNIGIKANAEFKAEGAAGAEVSTSAIAVLKGSLVQIN